MNRKELEPILSSILGEYIWLLIGMVILFAIKDLIAKFVAAILFFIGKDFNVDDIVYIGGEKRARIMRVGILRTTFFIYGSQRKLVVYNNKLQDMMIEKELPNHPGYDDAPIKRLAIRDKKSLVESEDLISSDKVPKLISESKIETKPGTITMSNWRTSNNFNNEKKED